MGIIEIETPTQGIVKVEIEGDTPNEEELQAIQQNFFAPQPQEKAELDLSRASVEEVREYAQKKRELGIDPITGQGITEEESLKDKDVDYTSGLQLFSIRAGLG